MNPSLLDFPSREEGLAFHLHLCDLNPAAVADICRAYLNPLLRWLAIKFANIDPHLRQTAVHEALMTYVMAPHSYDPTRADLGTFLRMAARCDLLNLLKGEGKHHQDRVAWEIVEHQVENGNFLAEQDPSLLLQRDEETRHWQTFLQVVAENFTDEEQQVLQLMLAGERKTGTYAAALGIGALSAAEQEREVKKVKDRIKKRVERGGLGHA